MTAIPLNTFMTRHPLADLCKRVAANLPARPFALAITMIIPIQPGQCPEALADDLRQWCDGVSPLSLIARRW